MSKHSRRARGHCGIPTIAILVLVPGLATGQVGSALEASLAARLRTSLVELNSASRDPIVLILDDEFCPREMEPRVQVIGTAADAGGHGTQVANVVCSTFSGSVVGVDIGFTSQSRYFAALESTLRFLSDVPNARLIVNCSFGRYVWEEPESPDREGSLIAALDRAGATIVAGVGNDSTDAPLYPAAYMETIAVAGVDRYGRNRVHSNFGGYVDIAAIALLSQYVKGDPEVALSGTSVAAAAVTGAIAELLFRNPGMSGEEALATLQRTGDRVRGTSATARSQLGGLVMNTERALGIGSGIEEAPRGAVGTGGGIGGHIALWLLLLMAWAVVKGGLSGGAGPDQRRAGGTGSPQRVKGIPSQGRPPDSEAGPSDGA